MSSKKRVEGMVSNLWEELLLGNAVERRLRPGENHPGNRGQGGPKNFVFTGRKGIFLTTFNLSRLGSTRGLPAFVLDVITIPGNEGRTGKSPFQPIDPECFAISGVVAGDDSAHACYQDESVYRGRRRRSRPPLRLACHFMWVLVKSPRPVGSMA